MADSKLRALTAIPLVLAFMFMFMISALVFGIIARAYLSGLESSVRESQEHSPKMKQDITIYVYNVSLCKMLSFITKSLKGQEIARSDTDISGPVKILILNQGGGVIPLDHIAVSFLGTKVYENDLNVKLKPGDYIVYYPRELSLPEDYEKLMRDLDTIVLHGGRETYQNIAFDPPPLSLVNIDEGGGCSEP